MWYYILGYLLVAGVALGMTLAVDQDKRPWERRPASDAWAVLVAALLWPMFLAAIAGMLFAETLKKKG